MRSALIAAGGALFAAAALAAGLAGPATAAVEDQSTRICDMETQEVRTWQNVYGPDKVAQGTRDAAACQNHHHHDHGHHHGHHYDGYDHHGLDSWALRYALLRDEWRLND